MEHSRPDLDHRDSIHGPWMIEGVLEGELRLGDDPAAEAVRGLVAKAQPIEVHTGAPGVASGAPDPAGSSADEATGGWRYHRVAMAVAIPTLANWMGRTRRNGFIARDGGPPAVVVVEPAHRYPTRAINGTDNIDHKADRTGM